MLSRALFPGLELFLGQYLDVNILLIQFSFHPSIVGEIVLPAYGQEGRGVLGLVVLCPLLTCRLDQELNPVSLTHAVCGHAHAFFSRAYGYGQPNSQPVCRL